MKEKEDILAQVGLGAMILFVGTLIAIVSSASVMILQLEIISEKTEAVVATTSKEAHTQVVFVGAWIHDAYDDYLFMIEYQSLGKEVQVEDERRRERSQGVLRGVLRAPQVCQEQGQERVQG